MKPVRHYLIPSVDIKRFDPSAVELLEGASIGLEIMMSIVMTEYWGGTIDHTDLFIEHIVSIGDTDDVTGLVNSALVVRRELIRLLDPYVQHILAKERNMGIHDGDYLSWDICILPNKDCVLIFESKESRHLNVHNTSIPTYEALYRRRIQGL